MERETCRQRQHRQGLPAGVTDLLLLHHGDLFLEAGRGVGGIGAHDGSGLECSGQLMSGLGMLSNRSTAPNPFHSFLSSIHITHLVVISHKLTHACMYRDHYIQNVQNKNELHKMNCAKQEVHKKKQTAVTHGTVVFVLISGLNRGGNAQNAVQGFDLELVGAVSSAVTIPVIASSGAGKPEHFSEVFHGTKVCVRGSIQRCVLGCSIQGVY